MSEENQAQSGEFISAANMRYVETDMVDDQDALLDALQKERISTIHACTSFQNADPKYMSIKAKLLKDTGDQILSQKRLKIEESAVQNDKDLAMHIAELSAAAARGALGNSPFARKVLPEGKVEPPKKVNRPDIKLNDTTMNESPTKVSYDKFMAEHYKEES